MVLFEVIRISASVIRIDMIRNFRTFALNFFNFKIILAPRFLKILLPPGFSPSIITAPFHNALLLVKFEVPMMVSKRLNIPCLVTCGLMTTMVLYGLTLISSLLFRKIPPLCSSVLLPILTREISQSPCTHMSIVALTWLE